MIRKTLIGATGVAIAAAAMPAQAQERYLGDIFIAGYTFCPRGTAEAEGQLLSIAQFTALFSLYGTTYGGNGQTTFALPDMRSRSPIGQGSGPGLTNYPQGATGGVENITLTINQLPQHTHGARIRASNDAPTTGSPNGATFATFPDPHYTNGPDNVAMSNNEVQVGQTGNGQSYSNRNPFLSLRYCVVLEGIYPSRN